MSVYRLTQDLVLWVASIIGIGDYAVHEPIPRETNATCKSKSILLALTYTACLMAMFTRSASADVLREPWGANRCFRCPMSRR